MAMDRSGASTEKRMSWCTCLAVLQVVLQAVSGPGNTVISAQVPPYCICAFECVCFWVSVALCACVYLRLAVFDYPLQPLRERDSFSL